VLIVEGNYRRRDTSHDRYRVFDIDGMGDKVLNPPQALVL